MEMETSGQAPVDNSSNRPAISRRSCDQCRSRKIGCDRASPCVNCLSARLNCTHSAVAAKTAPSRQRILISAEYERKIDNIARDIDGIKFHLRELNRPSQATQNDTQQPQLETHSTPSSTPQRQLVRALHGDPEWDHSPHILDFIKMVVATRVPPPDGTSGELFDSLNNLIAALDRPPATRAIALPAPKSTPKSDTAPPMPPLKAVVSVLRWAEEHAHFYRLEWVSHVLPLRSFAEVCKRVYFALDDYGEVDFVLANAYLAHVFAEHVITSGHQEFGAYFCMCRANLENALSALPLLLPSTMEVVAALTLAAFNAIESCNAMSAWIFVAAAADHCLRLGYCRRRPWRGEEREGEGSREAQERLFWVVHRLEKAVALRIGRASGIRDEEITLPVSPCQPRTTRLAKLQGRAYDELYSPTALARGENERGIVAEVMAVELRGLIEETVGEVTVASQMPESDKNDPMLVTYLQFEVVCQTSFLAFVLRAVPDICDQSLDMSKRCEEVAREVFDLHEQSISGLEVAKRDRYMMRRYVSWSLVHVPFIPFSILFTRAVQVRDFEDLARLERFAASLPLEDDADTPSEANPQRLYQLLCQSARLYMDSPYASTDLGPSLNDVLLEDIQILEPSLSGTNSMALADGSTEQNISELYDWFYSNQQMMNLLDTDYSI